ncbi:hypothetical protein JCM8547_005531 [Rhodosporidiobolus lusitaniae]
MADVWLRVWLCWVSLISYTIGFVIILKFPTLPAYIIGNIFTALGSSQLELLSSIIAADLVLFKVCGLAQGIFRAPNIGIPCMQLSLRWKAKKHGIITASSSSQFRLEAATVAKKEGHTHNTLVAVKPSLPLRPRLLLAWQELYGMGLLLFGSA